MRRRELLRLLGSAAVSWPLGARAQQAPMPVVGFLHGAVPDAYTPMTAAFRKSLSEPGDVTMEYRWAEGRLERLPELAGDLVRRRVSVIFAGGGSEPALAAKAATSEIPIVFATGADPVGVGLVASLNRPGGNVTGITFLLNTLGPKELEVLHKLQPKAADIAVLLNPNLATAASQSEDVRIAAGALGLKVHVFHASTAGDIESVFAALDALRAGGLLIGADAFLFSRRDQLVALAARYAVPTVYPWREAVLGGGLLSYGASVTDAYRLAGIYTGRILKGDKPADLPVQQSTRTEFAINLKTAKALGLDISPILLALADEVIE
jgi:putative tryptophan/tyrosine transport system substrate-binding protein